MVIYFVVINSTALVVGAEVTVSRGSSVGAGGEGVVLIVKAEVVDTRRRKGVMDEKNMTGLSESVKLSKFSEAKRKFANETDNWTMPSSYQC